MKKRVLFLVTAVCLFLTTVLGSSQMVSAATTGEPKTGDVIHGFKVKQTAYDSSTKSNEMLFEHVKTGAKLLVIKNSDINRGFSIKFNTPADNDKGINHIIEHSVLGGSKKYPSSNIIFDVMNTTYVSFANAFTFQNMTMYPICSANEKQLFKSADIYLDAVFNPLLLSDSRIFEREGLRTELKDAKSDLAYNGIVYSEMQGSMSSIEAQSMSNAKKAVFPNSNQGNISGGNPSDIRTLTYKEVINTYKKNYHPSNSFMVLYGDVNYEAFLKMVDENYLSSYSKKKVTIDRGTQKPFKKLSKKSYTVPVAAGTDTKNKSVIDLVFATSDIKELGMDNYVALSTAIALLNMDNSSFKQALMKSKIGESYSVSFDSTTYQPSIHFMANNADPSKSNEFYQLVLKELKNTVKEGLDTELIKSSVRSMEFEEALGSDQNSALNKMMTASLFDNLMGNPLVDVSSYYRKLINKLDDKVLEKLIEKQIIKNKLAALTVSTPKAGLLEKNQKAVAKVLADKKASMAKKDINALVKKTAAFQEWNSKETPAEVIKSLRAVSLKDINVELKDREIKETKVDGANLLTVKADVDRISSIDLRFDLSHLTPEELLYLNFYSDMIGNGMATSNKTESQVLNEMALKTNTISTSVSAIMGNEDDSSAHPVFSVNYYGFKDEYADTFALVSDVLLNSKVEDVAMYGTRTIANLKADYQSQFAEPLNIATLRSMAYTSQLYRYANYLTGLDYYKFILDIEKQIANNPAEVVKKITEVRTKAFNKNNLDILFAGDESAQSLFKSSITDLTGKLPDTKYEKAVYSLPKPAKREALVINSTVQYVCVNASLSESKVPQSGKGNVIMNLLNNLLLTPEIRLKGGAYGASAAIMDDTYLAYTFRDNNYVNSMKIIGATDEFLKALTPYMTDETLESYKLSTYAAASPIVGELDDAYMQLLYHVQGISTQDRINGLTEIKESGIADIETFAGYMGKLNDNQNYVIVAPSSEINANKDMFDSIITLQ
ncbi:insulinase family protein [Anaerocolumna sp.]|uniref:insulinase family protein n=1 Tax=Anaerocolumna sp. TaxID=2041569 RepID=UPI0028B066B7|nr:insulinase family protein [Anaerocolumna sp.]